MKSTHLRDIRVSALLFVVGVVVFSSSPVTAQCSNQTPSVVETLADPLNLTSVFGED
jgi:hypothetical protein